MTDRPTRRDLMKPVQLLGLAFVTALFAGLVTLISMGFFQSKPGDQIERALVIAAIAAGVTFIVVLVVVALLLLAVDPSEIGKSVDRPVLLPPTVDDARDDTTRPGTEPPADGGPAPRA